MEINKEDWELKAFMHALNLKEEKNKYYDINSVAKNIVYVFNDGEAFKNYFARYGIKNEKLISMCQLKKTKSGSIIAIKVLCDHLITSYATKVLENKRTAFKNLYYSLYNDDSPKLVSHNFLR